MLGREAALHRLSRAPHLASVVASTDSRKQRKLNTKRTNNLGNGLEKAWGGTPNLAAPTPPVATKNLRAHSLPFFTEPCGSRRPLRGPFLGFKGSYDLKFVYGP